MSGQTTFDLATLAYTKGVINYPNVEARKQRRAARKEGMQEFRGIKGKESFKASLAEGKSHVREEFNVYDARPLQDQLDMDTHGLMFAHLATKLPQTIENALDEKETAIREIFFPEVEELAKRTVRSQGRIPKYAFALGVQKFVPLTKEQQEGIKNPFGALAATYAGAAHADFSEVVFDSAYKMLTKRGIPEEEALSLDLMFVNSWKPYGQTVKDNPFAILDWTTVDPKKDVHIHRRGKPTAKGAIYGSEVTYNPNHRWFYLPEQQDDEVWFFKQGDSRAVNKQPESLAQYGFHTSWKLPDDPGKGNQTRRSIAVRLLLAFERTASSKL